MHWKQDTYKVGEKNKEKKANLRIIPETRNAVGSSYLKRNTNTQLGLSQCSRTDSVDLKKAKNNDIYDIIIIFSMKIIMKVTDMCMVVDPKPLDN